MKKLKKNYIYLMLGIPWFIFGIGAIIENELVMASGGLVFIVVGLVMVISSIVIYCGWVEFG